MFRQRNFRFTKMFRQRKFHFGKMFCQRKFCFSKMFPQRKFYPQKKLGSHLRNCRVDYFLLLILFKAEPCDYFVIGWSLRRQGRLFF